MTNAHVIDGSDKVIVGLTNGKKFRAKLVGQDLFTDLAILKIEGKGPWPKAQLGDSSKVNVGDWAIAVGNPFGLENTVTLGIISNLKRNVTQLGIYDKKLELIQTDAAINPGNSGGPLLNSNGEVIGINTLIRSGPGAGLSFAIPINKAKEIAYQLINNGKVIHPMIGISLIDESNFETKNNAVKVGYVVPNSPAAKIGIQLNDIIIKVGNKDIKNASEVISEISKNGINKKLNIVLKRRNKFINLKVIPTDITNLQNN
jgi:S1-C subfamily serine protease